MTRIITGDPPSSGEKGYYFALAHSLTWHEFASRLAASLHTRGLVASEEVKVWSSDDEAAEALGVPAMFVGALWNSCDNFTAHNEERLGWKPVWKREEFYEKFDDEVGSVVELGTAKSSLIESLRKAASG